MSGENGERPNGRGPGLKEHRGQGAVLGVRLLRYGGVQGVAIGVSSMLHLATIFVVASFLGPAELGRFAVLFFGATLLAQILTVAVKPGTIRRTFGADDDEDDDDETGEAAASPVRALGTGLALTLLLGLAGTAAGVAAREPLAEWLLGDRGDADLVVWAAVLGGATVVFRVATIVVWFERRPGAFLVAEVARPVIGLVAATALLAAGAGLEAVLAGAAVGTVAAAVVGFVVLRDSFTWAFDRTEIGQILHRGMIRAPVMMSFWTIVNADVFILSRYVSDTDLGIYTLASRVAFVAAFLPQSFRIALRPLRKAAVYQAVEDEYGQAEQRGQILGYFVLLCVSAILAVVLLGRAIVAIAPASFEDAAPLIPATAAALVWPALLRTVNQQTSWPGRTKVTFICCSVLAACVFIATTALLTPELGVYAAPVGIVAGLAPPSLYLFIRSQRGPQRIAFPYRQVATGIALAVVAGGAFELLPALPALAELAIAIAFGVLYVVSLFVLRVIPEAHWQALAHMTRSVVSGKPDRFKPRLGLRALDAAERDDLRSAVAASWASRSAAGAPAAEAGRDVDGARALALLRRAAARGGVAVGEPGSDEERIGAYVFSAAPTAVRNAEMRRLLGSGVDAAELHLLEDLVEHLAAAPDAAWRLERGRRSLLRR